MQVRRSCIQFLKGCNPHCNRSVLQIYKSSESRVLHRLCCAVPLFQFFRLDVMCWTMCTMAFFCLHKMWNWMHAWQVATPWLAMYADEQQLSHHFMVFQKLFCIKVIWLKYETHTQACTQATHPRTRAYTRTGHTRAHKSHTLTHTHAHTRVHASSIQPVWCVFTC